MEKEGISANNRMDNTQQAIEMAVTLGKAIGETEGEKRESPKSYSGKNYSKPIVHENGNVEHPYDTDCPYCHNLSQTDMVAMRGKMRTEQSMKYWRDKE